ncbi:MAG: hypothetical protein LBC18_16280 [Opitutaceae bacterium]|jgi:hypothetical protein|nr:hypothetical protein [Opitutaceae bacterium]
MVKKEEKGVAGDAAGGRGRGAARDGVAVTATWCGGDGQPRWGGSF